MSAKVAFDVLRAVDCCAVFAAGWCAFLLYLSDTDLAWAQYSLVALLGSFLAVNILQMAGAYYPDRLRRPLSHLQDLGSALLLTAAALVAIAFLTKTSDHFSRGWGLLWIALAFVGLVGVRGALFLATTSLQPTSRSGWLRRDVAVVGSGPEVARLIAHIDGIGEQNTRIIGVFDDHHAAEPATVDGYPVRGRVADLCAYARTHPLDTIYVAMPWSAEEALLETCRQLECLPVDIRLVLTPIGYRLLNRRVSCLHQLPAIHIADRPLGDWGRLLKWIEDYAVATLALTMSAPLMLLIAIAIKLESPGPVLFRQNRYGFNNRLIEVLKFRTMRHDQCDPEARRLTRRDDPRVTRLGAVLRRSSLDELPQLINVLRGEMSIVGPRPHAVEAKAADRLYQDVVAGYAARHKVKPGLTGWAQVNGWRGTTETEHQIRKRVECDLFYLENWSIGFDLKIIVMTLLTGFFGKDAY